MSGVDKARSLGRGAPGELGLFLGNLPPELTEQIQSLQLSMFVTMLRRVAEDRAELEETIDFYADETMGSW